MISYKRDVLERQSLSEVKMGRGSPICERVRKKIVEYFKNNIPQCQIAKTLQISSSTVHNIIKRFRETGALIQETHLKQSDVAHFQNKYYKLAAFSCALNKRGGAYPC